MSQTGHRSTLKQKNKPFKSKFASKGEIKRRSQGRVAGEERKGPKQKSKEGSKERRKHQARQLREDKRQHLVQSRRHAAQGIAPPKIVGFVDLSTSSDSGFLISKLQTLSEIVASDKTFAAPGTKDAANAVVLDHNVTVFSTIWKQRLSLRSTSRDTLSMLDLAKVADILVFVMSGEDNEQDLIDETARELIRLISIQGFGLVYGVIQGGHQSHHSKLRKYLEHELQNQFGEEPKIIILPGTSEASPVDSVPMSGPNHEGNKSVESDHNRDSDQDHPSVKNFLRLLCQSNPQPAPISRHQKRSFLVAEALEFIPSGSDQTGDLIVQGYVRGAPLSINQLVHIPECDDFFIRSIVQAADPCPISAPHAQKNTSSSSSSSEAGSAGADVAMGGAADPYQRRITPGTLLLTSHDDTREPLIQENIPDSLEGEQNISDDDGGDDAEMEERRLEIIRSAGKKKVLRRVPKGTTAYHASWIIDSDEEEILFGDEEDDDDEDQDSDGNVKDGRGEEGDDEEMQGLSSKRKPKKEQSGGMEDGEISFKKPRTTIQYDSDEEQREGGGLKDDGDEEEEEGEEEEDDEEEYEYIDVEAEKERMRKESLMKRLAQMEQEEFEFPDEVDTPFDISARERFAKYRGLKSFRTSPWDPKENLPRDYSRIFQFQNFNHTQRRVLKRADDSESPDVVQVGSFVSVVVANISFEAFQFVLQRNSSLSHPIILFGLLQHERKVSVIHSLVKRSLTFQDPIRSKDEMLMQIGFRRLRCCPIYSENSLKTNKYKMQKFFPHGEPSIASVYGPITFLPANVMMFRLSHTGKLDLVADGALHSVNPNRLVIKKIVLVGHIFKIYRRKCVVRGMFHDPLDIKWFKPVELHTKKGRCGHILEPVGTHGYMKCIFDHQLQFDDMVTMSLYKRAFPVWRSQYYSHTNLGPTIRLEEELESKIIEHDARSTRSRRSTRSKRSNAASVSSRRSRTK